mgnify:CR=1 FL=1
MTTDTLRPSWHTNFYDVAPCSKEGGAQHWVTRGANFAVMVSRVQEGTVLERAGQVDEYFVLLPHGVAARLEAGEDAADAQGDTVAIMPPGASRITARAEGYVYRIFTNRAEDVLALADNASAYADGAPQVAPLEDWPEPVGGYRLRVYPLAQYSRPGVFGRLFRTRNLMINPFDVAPRPRDPKKMTPHAHDDFEQGSLVIQGKFIHHLRYPWGPDLTAWREDEHIEVGSPSLIVIPPRSVHTSQSLGDGPFQLMDIFAPPRDDFSSKPGLVCNADEYPAPERLQAALAAKAA